MSFLPLYVWYFDAHTVDRFFPVAPSLKNGTVAVGQRVQIDPLCKSTLER